MSPRLPRKQQPEANPPLHVPDVELASTPPQQGDANAESPAEPRPTPEGYSSPGAAPAACGVDVPDPACPIRAVSDEFVQLQAVLAIMPMHALNWRNAYPGCDLVCAGSGRASTCSDQVSNVAHIDAILAQQAEMYPGVKQLSRLCTVSVSGDMVCFASHTEKKLFVAVRGTDAFTARDMGNNMLIAVGKETMRSAVVREEYCRVRDRFPEYSAVGCGHSLGGSVMHELAYRLESEDRFAFTRVDVFNPGSSPLRRQYTTLNKTEFYSHRVVGDIVSYSYQSVGKSLVYAPQTGYSVHSMGHFLPPREPLLALVPSWLGCCTSRRRG
mmetsp:Transcript_120504/g.341490  ORF Transcript_120504/g.341490 Transcript_120504/m.341490 type:complete len:327 (-) Transcript_120504:84-1064(-)